MIDDWWKNKIAPFSIIAQLNSNKTPDNLSGFERMVKLNFAADGADQLDSAAPALFVLLAGQSSR